MGVDMASRQAEADTKQTRLSVSLPAGDYEHLNRLAKRKRVSLAWIVRDAVRQYLDAAEPLFKDLD